MAGQCLLGSVADPLAAGVPRSRPGPRRAQRRR